MQEERLQCFALGSVLFDMRKKAKPLYDPWKTVFPVNILQFLYQCLSYVYSSIKCLGGKSNTIEKVSCALFYVRACSKANR